MNTHPIVSQMYYQAPRKLGNNAMITRKEKIHPQKQSSGGVLRKGVLRNFAKLTGKHLCQGLFLIKLQALFQGLFFNKATGPSLKREYLHGQY